MKAKESLAKIVRVVSVLPIMVSILIIALILGRPDLFDYRMEASLMILLLGIVPIIAYPIQMTVPSLKNTGRDGQRKLAFIFSLAGYTSAFIWAIVSKVNRQILLICLTYFISVIVLTVFNKVASGHACSVTSPLFFLVYYVDWKFIFPSLIIAALVAWSSVYLKRHTKTQLLVGCLFSLSHLESHTWQR